MAGRAEAVERVEAVVVAGQVHAPQRLGTADDRESLAQLRRQRVGEVARNGSGKLREDPPQRLYREAAELLVHRHQPPGVDPAVLVLLDELVLRRAHQD